MCTCCDNHKIKPRKLIEKADTLNDNWWYPEKKKNICIDGCDCRCAHTCSTIYNFRLYHLLIYELGGLSECESDSDYESDSNSDMDICSDCE